MTASRRGFLRAMAMVPAAAAFPAEKLPAPRPALTIARNYYVDWHLVKSCDVWVDYPEQDETGFTIEIYDQTNRRPYVGYIKWWILRHEDDERSDAILSGYAQVVDNFSVSPQGVARINFKDCQP